MKQTKLALSAIMIVAVGLIGTNFVTGSEMIEQEKFAIANSNPIYGHITIVHSDPDGNILAYIQTDNLVGANGKDCLADLVFGDHSAACEAGSTNTIFTTIALYNGETFPITMNVTDQSGTGSENLLETSTLITADGLTVRNGGQGVVVSEDAPAVKTTTCVASNNCIGSKTDIVKTFTAGAGVSGITINGAALMNNGTGVGTVPTAVLAGQVFTAGSVTLNDSDTLLITWTITLG